MLAVKPEITIIDANIQISPSARPKKDFGALSP